ncbi:MAG: hypothetical protein IT581_15035 [Verrucomicrobiales bacterium]|nr:hypothetical protein [Verrucomicrobiales bacterium]
MKSLKWRITCWFAASLLAVLSVFVAVTYLHLQHELRLEKWERAHPDHSDWVLHGSYSRSEVDDIAGELGRLSLLYAVPVAILALAIGRLFARRSLQPVEDLSQQLRTINARSLKDRVRLHRADREFQAIETSINGLLERLEGAFKQLTEYSAQVAHELRTPLTLLRLKVEDAAGRIEPGLAETLQEELQRLSDYVDQSLLLATAEQGRLILRPERVILGPLLDDLLETYQLWARHERRILEFTTSAPITIAADPRYLRQMLHNLLTNALRHGTGPIRVTLETLPGAAACRIENAVASTTHDPANAGLGLRVVQALAAVQGCQFTTRRAAGAFIAEIQWSALPGDPAATLTPSSRA